MSARCFFYPVDNLGETVEQRLLREGYSKRLIVQLKQQPDGLTVGGERVRSTRALSAGELLLVTLPLDPPRLHRLDCAVPVLFEDEDLIVYNKPAGMVCHRSGSHQRDTLENVAEGVFRAMNRLDRDTSGALVTAKHQLAAAKLWQKIDKQYFAAVSGRMNPEQGMIDLPLLRETPFEPRQVVSPDGLSACTEYETLGYCAKFDCSLLRCLLHTGRMHQIRVHCAAVGHPLLGDVFYGGDPSLIERQALHCAQVTFLHPVSGEAVRILAPPPEDFLALLRRCNLNYNEAVVADAFIERSLDIDQSGLIF